MDAEEVTRWLTLKQNTPAGSAEVHENHLRFLLQEVSINPESFQKFVELLRKEKERVVPTFLPEGSKIDFSKGDTSSEVRASSRCVLTKSTETGRRAGFLVSL